MSKKQVIVVVDEKLHHAFKLECLKNETNMKDVITPFIEQYIKGSKPESCLAEPIPCLAKARKARSKKAAPKPSHTPEELEIFEYWKERMGKSNNAKLNGKREQRLRDRLKDGYSVEYIKQAIDGCARSPHHMGQNLQGTVYDDLELICRDATGLEKFAESVGKLPPKRQGSIQTMEDFRREGEEQCRRIFESGLLDDILEQERLEDERLGR